MAGLWWMTVMLVFFQSVGSLDAVDQKNLLDQKNLAELIKAVTEAYQPEGMYSLALSIQSEDPENVKQLIKDNPVDKVKEQLSKGEVYEGKTLAVAKVKQPEHAELRVLEKLKLVSNKGDLLVIYSHASSCPGKCTNKEHKYNIIDPIKTVIANGKWSSHVFVFEKVFKPKDGDPIDKSELIKALEELGTSGIPLANIFRCYKPKNINFQCTSCSSEGKVTDACID